MMAMPCASGVEFGAYLFSVIEAVRLGRQLIWSCRGALPGSDHQPYFLAAYYLCCCCIGTVCRKSITDRCPRRMDRVRCSHADLATGTLWSMTTPQMLGNFFLRTSHGATFFGCLDMLAGRRGFNLSVGARRAGAFSG